MRSLSGAFFLDARTEVGGWVSRVGESGTRRNARFAGKEPIFAYEKTLYVVKSSCKL